MPNHFTAPAASCSAPGAVGAASNYSCTTLANPNPHDPWVGTITQSTTSTTVLTDTGSAYAFDTLGLSDYLPMFPDVAAALKED